MTTPWQHPDALSSYHLYPIKLRSQGDRINQLLLHKKLQKNGISANLHYIPIHRQPYFENLGFKSGDFPEAEKYFTETISLPIYPNLRRHQQSKVMKIILEFLR